MKLQNTFKPNQSGLSLPIVMILLVPLTLMAVTVAKRNNLEELMAASQRDAQQSLMNAETGLALAHEVLDRVDAGTFSSTLDEILATGDIGYTGYTLTDGVVTVVITDNYEPEEDIDPGFQLPYVDTDGRVVATSTGFYQGGERVVEAIYYLESTGAGAAPGDPLVIFAEDDLGISGDPFIWGPYANVHTNSNMDISGNPEIWGSVTAAGNISIGGSPVDQNGDPITYTEGVDAIPTPYVYPPVYKPFATYYLTKDCDVYDGDPNPLPGSGLTAGTLVFNDVKNNGPWNGWNCDYGIDWKMDTGDWIEGFFYSELNVMVSANPGEGEPEPANFSIVSEGFIEISGNPVVEPYWADQDFDSADYALIDLYAEGRENVLATNEVLFYAGNDLKLNGNAEQQFSGIMAAHMEFDISGNPSLKGAVVAENGRAQEQQGFGSRSQEVTDGRDVKNMVDQNWIGGAPEITDDTDGGTFSPGEEGPPAGATREGWREIVE